MPKHFSDKMKVMKLIVHQKNFSEEEIIINQKDFPEVKKGDLLEIYDPSVDFSHLLLQVTCIKDDNVSQKDSTISIEQSIAFSFNLRTYEMVHVNVVDRSTVALDSLEVTFKDQYLGRSDMWRLKKSLIGTCVYVNKKIEFCHKTVRCQVFEMWGQGEKVACGVVVEDTKIVFRSSTSLVYLFIQMSSEMWDFDIYGDLYFEKAVNGFLTDLFTKWKKENSNHEVTIVLFSRVFYKANALEDFPESMRGCLQKDYRGRFCEDFYRVAVQSERYDDWASILVQLRRLFNEWPKTVLEYHQKPGVTCPRAVNSTAAQGNFLEVLNMSLNVFEKHYLDRSFDRTGQLSVVITPGVGVYEVDRELTNLTKQRIIDNGVGSDLVCVGEQPLHAVPLLKFHNKHSSLSTANDFSMPHWINLSFYSSSKKVGYSTFVPRIKLPPARSKPTKLRPSLPQPKPKANEPNNLPNSLFDYDAYDSQVFALPTTHGARNTQTQPRSTPSANRTRQIALDDNSIMRSKPARIARPPEKETQLAPPNTEILSTSLGVVPIRTPAITIPPKLVEENLLSTSMNMAALNSKPRHPSGKDNKEDDDKDVPLRPIVGSADDKDKAQYKKNAIRTGRALINPFDPSHVTIKLTSNRRRWTHIFPKGPTGVLIQQHHYQAIPANRANFDYSSALASSVALTITNTDPPRPTQFIPRHRTSTVSSVSGLWDTTSSTGASNKRRNRTLSKTLTLLWGATGEQEWTPALTTGVDWKSLTIPACLPITTDYFPDKRSLQNDYVVSDYSLLPDDVNADYVSQRGVGRRHLTTLEVFHELISQRLAQGFQLIVKDKDKPGFYNNQVLTTPTSPAPSSLRSRLQSSSPSDEYFLSIGRIFHKIGLQNSTITVTGYRPRHPYPTQEIHYRYRLQTPDQTTYGVAWVDFNAEKLENYNWNYLDHYVCTRGDRDFALTESLKYWRLRLCLLPCAQRAPRQAEENYAERFYPYDEAHYVENVLKFLETCINKDKLRKNPVAKKVRGHVSNVTSLRERGGSNRITERPRSRLVERIRTEVGTVRVSSVDSSSSGFGDGRSSSLGSLTTESSDMSTESEGLLSLEGKRIRAGASLEEIVDLMKNPIGGLVFLTVFKFSLLPPNSFIGADASAWLVENVEGVNNEKDASSILRKMVDGGLIRHASGNPKHPFKDGLYLYYICSTDKQNTKVLGEGDFSVGLSNDLESFQYEYVECEILGGIELPRAIYLEPDDHRFMEYAMSYKRRYDSMMSYKSFNLDMDLNGKSDRVEWGHLKYQATVLPDAGFEIIIQWMACTGALVADMVQNWVRKATTCGLQLVSMPCDPFALPLSHKADPLRSPIFVPLNLEGLGRNGKGFLEKFPAVSWAQRLFFFQESIVRHFGFLPCNPDPASPFFTNQLSSSISTSHSAKQATQDRQFMHVCGAMFVLILSSVVAPDNVAPPITSRKNLKNESGFDVKNPRGYITRHVVGKRKWEQNKDVRVGFLWSWNSMVGKKIRTNLAGEEVRLLSEFRRFCANESDLLRKFLEASEKS